MLPVLQFEHALLMHEEQSKRLVWLPGLTGFYLSGNIGFPYTLTVFLPCHTWWPPAMGLCLSMTSEFRFQLTFQHTSHLVRLSVGLDAWYLKWLLIWLDVPFVFLFLKFASILCSLFPYIYIWRYIFVRVYDVWQRAIRIRELASTRTRLVFIEYILIVF